MDLEVESGMQRLNLRLALTATILASFPAIMASCAPVEIWEKILKYAISVPLFFESDPATSCGLELLPRYYDEADYWQSEKIRNNLKRVCHSWESFIGSYDHRYVRLADIYHQRIPVNTVPLSIRLNIDPDYDCSCIKYCKPYSRQAGGVKLLRKAMMIELEEKQACCLEWRTEILDGCLPSDPADFRLLLKRMPRLRAAVHCEESKFTRLQEYPTTLRFLSLPGAWGSYPLTVTRGLTFIRLTTLQLQLESTDLSDTDWSLPSLQHLSMRLCGLAARDPHHLLGALKRLGANLLTFYLRDDAMIEEAASEEIWGYIPRVERIELPYWGSISPPENHPARYARIPMDTLEVVRLREYTATFLAPWLPKWGFTSSESIDTQYGQTRTMIAQMDKSWLWYLTDDCADLPLLIAEFYGTRGIRFMDNGGVTIYEYLLFMVKWYWKGGRASRRLHGSYRDLFPF